MTGKLEGKVAIVTGASARIGEATAIALLVIKHLVTSTIRQLD